jgi:hypothetical protein
VTFKDGSTTLGTATLSGGAATLTTAALAVGSHSFTAAYAGDGNFTASTSAALAQTVQQAGSTTVVSSSANPSAPGKAVTFTATVAAAAPGSGTPTGTVTFKDGSTTLGTATLSGGAATLTTSALAAGSHPITATYSGDANFAPSTSATLTQVVSVAPSATFVKTDTTTKGSWKGVYGADGYNVIDNAASYPSYAQVTPSGQSDYVWAASTTDLRALQKAGTATDRIAAAWNASTSFTIDLNLTDGKAHRVALYLLDWDNAGRSERVDVIDPSTGKVLNSQTVSGFGNGKYLVWNITGHVQIKITRLAGPDAVLSGLFFG